MYQSSFRSICFLVEISGDKSDLITAPTTPTPPFMTNIYEGVHPYTSFLFGLSPPAPHCTCTVHCALSPDHCMCTVHCALSPPHCMFKQPAADAAGRMPCHRHTALHNLEYVILPIDKSDGCEQAMSRGREFLSRLMEPTNETPGFFPQPIREALPCHGHGHWHTTLHLRTYIYQPIKSFDFVFNHLF